MIPTVLGVDPGGAATGLCVRRGPVVVGHGVVEAPDALKGGAMLASPEYLAAIRLDVLEALARGIDGVAIEGVRKPNPHLNRRNGKSVIDPGPIIATGVVLGAVHEVVTGAGIPVVWVPPGKNGSQPLYAYPAELVSDAERRHGLNRVGDGGILRHARSAYDVAGHPFTRAMVLACKPARTHAR